MGNNDRGGGVLASAPPLSPQYGNHIKPKIFILQYSFRWSSFYRIRGVYYKTKTLIFSGFLFIEGFSVQGFRAAILECFHDSRRNCKGIWKRSSFYRLVRGGTIKQKIS